jgi:hypothetical protein
MLATLDARLAQAHGGELGHLDFLQVLSQDEITRRETVAFQRRLQRAKFEQQVTLEEFDFTASSKLPAALIRDLGALRWLHAGESVILFGPAGVGKTHIAQALGPTSRFGRAPTSASPRPAGSSPNSPVAKRTAPGRNGSANWYDPTCSSLTTSPCASSPRPTPTTSTNSSASGRDGP